MHVELPKIGIHYIPPVTEIEDLSSDSELTKLNFYHFIHPFVDLMLAPVRRVFAGTRVIREYCQRLLFATRIVFYRMICSPSFDPTHSSFKKLLDRFENEIPQLEKRIEELEQRFWWDHSISRDAHELKKLNDEVSETLRQVTGYANILGGRRFRFPVQDQLDHVKESYEKLSDQIDLYCLNQGEAILQKFQGAVYIFTKVNIGLPEDIRKPLIQTWNDLHIVLRNHIVIQLHRSEGKKIREAITEIKNQIAILKKQSPEKVHTMHFAHPLKLKNIGNSCYLDSVLQALLCVSQVRDEFSEPIARDPKKPLEYQKKLAIQQEILQFIQAQPKHESERNTMSEMEFILLLMGGPSLFRLRDAIFKSGLHHEFQMSNLKDQLDAASVAELLSHEFLAKCKFKSQAIATTPVFPGLQFKRVADELSVLQVPLRSQARYHRLDSLVHTTLGLHVEREKNPSNQRTFDPQEGEIIAGKEEEADKVKMAAPTKVDEFREKYKFLEMPSVLVIQFKRFINKPGLGKHVRLVKDTRPVILPYSEKDHDKDGILDLSQYYDAPKGKSKTARYRIKSMVRHKGSLDNGHYVAEVEINGKYYQCDDLDPNGYKEVSKPEFYSHKDPYLLILERIPEDKIEVPVKKK